MIPSIAYLVACYAIARLVAIPVQAWEPQTDGQVRSKSAVLVLIALVGVLGVVICVGMVHQASERVRDIPTLR